MFSLEQKIKALNYEKDTMASDTEDRGKLNYKKEELENCRRKMKKMQVFHYLTSLNLIFFSELQISCP